MNKEQYLVKIDLAKNIVSQLNIPDDWDVISFVNSTFVRIRHLTEWHSQKHNIYITESHEKEFSIIFEDFTHDDDISVGYGPFTMEQLIQKVNSLFTEIKMNEILDK